LYGFDVAVVGGGCAGLWAAKTAAQNGARTLLIEKQKRIGDRIACAEGIGSVGISSLLELKPEWVATSIDSARLVPPDGAVVEMSEPGCGYVLNKGLFLRGLAEMVAQEGAEIWLGSEVKGVDATGSGELRLRISRPDGSRTVLAGSVVAADGIEAGIARKAGIHGGIDAAEVFSCAQDTVSPIEVRSNTVEFYFGQEVAPGGYAWVFPKGDSVANVGVGLIYDTAHNGRASEYLERFKQERCPGGGIVGRIVGGVPSVRDPFRACGGGIFAAGDAARIADPVSGGGIVKGMESGAAAGRCAARYASAGGDGGDAEKQFTDELKHLYKDRSLRFAVRRVVSTMSDKELSRLIEAVGEFSAGGSFLKADPFRIVKFLVKVMPNTFGLVKHLLRS
jgi:digeranylgeranylglycerophospholipid reductase